MQLLNGRIKCTDMQRLSNRSKHCAYHFKGERQDIECYFPFIRTIHYSLFPIVGLTTTLAITTLYEKLESCRYSRAPLYVLTGLTQTLKRRGRADEKVSIPARTEIHRRGNLSLHHCIHIEEYSLLQFMPQGSVDCL